MLFISSINKNFAWIWFFPLLINPAMAHNIQVAGDVAGTWHIEPNHQPKAGESARAWVALTRKGGKTLPFSEASCQMVVYSQPRKQSDTPVLQLIVQAINTEKYQDIPSADIVFPKTGLYQLELTCTPKTEGDFKAFQLKYDLTVATSAAVSPKAKTLSQKTTASADIKESDRQQGNLLAIASVVLGLGIVMWRIIKR